MGQAFCIMFLLFFANYFLFFTYKAQAEAAAEADLVSALPGQPNVEFSQYAGYVTVNVSHGRSLFYWFMEASVDPSSKPFLLWLNGGPGCSSVGYGAAQEIGAFRVKVNGTGLEVNPYSWNTEANTLFVESPAGVGFSYSNVSSDYANFGDNLTAHDMFAFLEGWFQRFPQYKANDFYIAGESYAGHYVLELAELIHDRNMEVPRYPFLKLKGFMVGNPTTDDYEDTRGFVDYAWSHAIISDKTYDDIRKLCNFKSDNWTTSCIHIVNSIFTQYNTIDIYNLYAPKCLLAKNNNTNSSLSYKLSHFGFFKGKLKREIPSSCGYHPCIENYVESYFNRLDVQQALHANVTHLSHRWSHCSSQLTNWTEAPFSVLPIYRKLIAAGIRIWVYSGDTDGRVPVTATRYSINALNLSVIEPWRPWYHKKQVGGWTERYEGLVFVTIRGSGHMVPSDAPSRALALFKAFLSGHMLSL